MTSGRARRIAVAAVAAYVVLTSIGLSLQLSAPAQDLPADEEGYAALDLLFGLVLLIFTLVGAVIAARRPSHPVGWLLLVLGLANAAHFFSAGYARQALISDPGSLPAGEWAAWTSSWVGEPSLVVFIFLLLLFPDGRLPSRRWRPIAWLVVAMQILILVDLWLTPGRLYGFEDVENPVGLDGAGFLRSVDLATAAALLALPAVAGLFVKRRRATSEERLQLKWFLFAGSLLAVLVPAVALLEGLGRSPDSGTADLVGGFAFALLFANLAIAIGIAVLKHRLYDIDVVINRTLVYGALTATLVGAYLGLVLLLQLALGPLTEDNDLAIAGSTLAVAALFRPFRARIQRLVDRRFYRRRYDAARTLESFGARLRDEIDLHALGGELRTVVADTLAPAHLSLWLRGSGARDRAR